MSYIEDENIEGEYHEWKCRKNAKDTKEEIIAEVENEILELVDHQDDYTRSDLQGRAMAIAMKAHRAGAIDSALEDYKKELREKIENLRRTKGKLTTHEQTWYFVDGYNDCRNEIIKLIQS